MQGPQCGDRKFKVLVESSLLQIERQSHDPNEFHRERIDGFVVFVHRLPHGGRPGWPYILRFRDIGRRIAVVLLRSTTQ